MSEILSVKPDSLRGDTSIDRQGAPSRSFGIQYTVRGDTCQDDPETIKQTTGIPRVGSLLNGMICKKVDAQEDDTFARLGANFGLWTVDVRFDTDVVVHSDRTDPVTGEPLPPQDWTPEWSWSYEEVQEVAEQDYEYDTPAHRPIVNALGHQILVDTPRTIPVLTITRYETAFDPNIEFTYGNRVNDTPFWGAPKGSALMMPPRDSPADKTNPSTGAQLRFVEYTVKFSNRLASPNSYRLDASGAWEQVTGLIGWRANPLAKGTHYFNGSGTAVFFQDGPIPFEEERTGQRREGLIKFDGQRLIPKDFTGDPTTIPPHYYVFLPYRRAELNDLNLGPF